MNLIQEIQARLEKESRSPQELYNEVRQLGVQMAITNNLGKTQVVMFCSSLLKLYELLASENS